MIDSTTRMVFGILAIMAPLLPVYIMYRLMGPVVAKLQGKISRWSVHLGGPAALYFLLVWQLLGLVPGPPRIYEPWRITGRLLLEDQHEPVTEDDVSIAPPDSTIDNRTGNFTIDVVAKPNNVGEIELPDLVLSHPGYQVVNVSLKDKQDKHRKSVEVNKDYKTKTVFVQDVELKKVVP